MHCVTYRYTADARIDFGQTALPLHRVKLYERGEEKGGRARNRAIKFNNKIHRAVKTAHVIIYFIVKIRSIKLI